MTPRIFITMIGAWLLVSAFAWPHSHVELANVLAVGVLAPLFTWLSTVRDWARYASAAAGVWLILTTLRFGTASHATLVHNVIIGASIFVASLVAAGSTDYRHERELYGRV
jgi:uncharacterized membrane protein YjjP (DUF1212 family)